MSFLDRLFGDGSIHLQPEVLNRALALAGTDRAKLVALAAQETASRRNSGQESRKKADKVEAEAEAKYAAEKARIERERAVQRKVAAGLHNEAAGHEYEAELHSELARLLSPQKAA